MEVLPLSFHGVPVGCVAETPFPGFLRMTGSVLPGSPTIFIRRWSHGSEGSVDEGVFTGMAVEYGAVDVEEYALISASV